MSDQEQWGPWIEHDGIPNPLPKNTWVIVDFRSDPEPHETNPFKGGGWSQDIAWHWTNENDDVLRYRIRKPRGMAILERLARDVTAKIEQVDA